jgi:hypothetical protein
LFFLGLWLVLAILLGATGRIAKLPPPFPQLVLLALTLAALAAVYLLPIVRKWAATVSLRALVAWHLIRLLVGAYFLFLAQQATLARAFALPAGWGDIAVAIMAAALLLSLSPGTRPRRTCYSIWNVLGFVDILFVVVNAARIGMSAPASMAPLLHLPLSILPTFLVPTIIVSHLILFRRLYKGAGLHSVGLEA